MNNWQLKWHGIMPITFYYSSCALHVISLLHLVLHAASWRWYQETTKSLKLFRNFVTILMCIFIYGTFGIVWYFKFDPIQYLFVINQSNFRKKKLLFSFSSLIKCYLMLLDLIWFTVIKHHYFIILKCYYLFSINFIWQTQ